jgi:hypothetical protein
MHMLYTGTTPQGVSEITRQSVSLWNFPLVAYYLTVFCSHNRTLVAYNATKAERAEALAMRKKELEDRMRE